MKVYVSHVSKMLILTYNRSNSVITKTAIILNIIHNIFNLRNTECHIIVYGDIVNNLNTNCKLEHSVRVVKFELHTREWVDYYYQGGVKHV